MLVSEEDEKAIIVDPEQRVRVTFLHNTVIRLFRTSSDGVIGFDLTGEIHRVL